MRGTDRALIVLNILAVAALIALSFVIGCDGCLVAAESQPMWYRLPSTGRYQNLLADLESRRPANWRYWFADSATHAHELTHGIHADLRNRHAEQWACHYVGDGWCMYLPEPKVRVANVIQALPASLRRGRFQLYFVDQVRKHPHWEVTPIYCLFDEWVAYTNGAQVGLEEIRSGRERAKDDYYFACLEFSIYATAVVRAVMELDHGYALRHPEFAVFMKAELKRSLGHWREGQQIADGRYRWDDNGLAERFVNGREAAPLREAMVKLLGFEATEEILDLCR